MASFKSKGRGFVGNIGLYHGLTLEEVWSVDSDCYKDVEELLAARYVSRAFDVDDAAAYLASLCLPGAAYEGRLSRPPGTAALAQTAFFANPAGDLETIFGGHEGMGLDFMAHAPPVFLGHHLNLRAYRADRTRVRYVRYWKRGVTELVYQVVPEDNCCELRLEYAGPIAASSLLLAGQERLQVMARQVGNRNSELLKTIRGFATELSIG